jgi:4-aminobutyrate aminotransferase-like enzyme
MKTKIPGTLSKALARELKKYEAPTVTCMVEPGPIFWKKARGIHVWDADDNRYVDFTSAFGVASLGHSHPKVVKAIRQQSGRLCHAMGDVHPTEVKTRLCARLSEITYGRWTGGRQYGQTLLTNSGSEAVEAALKSAKMYTRKRGVIAFTEAYHGLGYGALGTTWRQDFRRPFEDQLGHFVEFIPFPLRSSDEARMQSDLLELEKGIRSLLSRGDTGAILVEPFQGRGGERIPPPGFLPMLRKVCDRTRTLLIVDEIYTGFWRTGKWFAVEHSNVVPDIICLGKALSGSLPLGACVGRADIMAAWPESQGEAIHTSTFLGNPLACAAALASIDVFDEQGEKFDVLEKGRKLLRLLQEQLHDRPEIHEIRGIGLMAGIEFKQLPDQKTKPRAVQLCEKLLLHGLITLPSGPRSEVLALTPPLIVPAKVLNQAAAKITAAIESD